MKLTIGALTVTAVLVSGCGGQDVRGPFRNHYVDAETGKPVEGVVFLAVWYTVTPNPVSGGSEHVYGAREAVSGPDGNVEIPGLAWWAWRPTLDVRMREFAAGGYGAGRLQVSPTTGQPYIDETTTFMTLKTREERCALLPYA
ncbi:MAG: hypothetical protein HY824_07410, partial [Acidobacteria bacterium]|nr:hypothetical protein [Acidobacteriota bacterium]